ncbi:AMIN-like domain-containing (lipo)protein [Streptomyces sp. NPDC002920]
MRRLGTALAALVLAGAGMAGAVGTAHADTAASTVCETGWGSLEKRVAPSEDYRPPLTDIRTGRHECFDRMVLDFKGSASGPIGYRVTYVDKLISVGTGEIPVSGGAILQISVGPNFDPATGSESYPGQHAQPLPGVDLTDYQTFKDTRYVDGLEDSVQIGVGVRARLPFRVTQLDDRLVIDVAHSWNATS